ncbi:rRNA N-glycosidase [Rhynchospora pubera]|uniref:rRNA N-glycosidase n=1 Tax=Rhynchospora pubera TaxID=906938 RepID=A0AAV8D9P8_9POAL|nr:rRNA N-glycosidase [Rhynchospora pubera]
MEMLSVKGEGGNVREAESSKVPHVEDQIGVHTRLPLLNPKQGEQQPKVMDGTVASDLMEVFSVRFVEFDKLNSSQIYGFLLISSFPTYVVFSRIDGEPLNIDSQGFVKLLGPDTVIVPNDSIEIYPYLFRYEAPADQFEDYDNELLWNHMFYCYFDTIMSRMVESQFGPIEVKYAAYRHGVVAHVDVTLTNCQFPSATVGGLITAQNSNLGEDGRSVLFKTDKNEGISIEISPCKDRIAQLPLARCKTAVPVNSSLTIYVDIWQCSITGTPHHAIIQDEKFEYVARLTGHEVRTFRGPACQINVVVTWSHYVA